MTNTELIRQTVIITMKELGYNLKSTDGTISQHQASKLLTRAKVESAMKEGYNKTQYVPGVVRWKKDDMSNPHCPVRVNRSDVFKLLDK